MNTNRPKIGLALGSGGARGLAHIGVIKILEQNNIPIDMIAGASLGALIGAFYAKNLDSTQLEELGLSFNRRKGVQLFDPTLKGGLIKGNKIEQFISDLLGDTTFESLQIPFSAIATDFNTAAPFIIQHGNLVKAIRASISVPAVFQPVSLDNHILADGGLSNPVPADVVRAMGADIVIAVNLDTVYVTEPTTVPSLSSTPLQSINILRHHLAAHSSKTADIVITPIASQNSIIGWDYFFDSKKAQQTINEGMRSTNEHITEIKKIASSKFISDKTPNKMVQFFRQYVPFMNKISDKIR